jgi:methylmalonyl-CoA mutase N-terminal domain/subunit
LRSLRASRSAGAVTAALERLTHAARGEQNLLPPIVEAAEAWATVGEISSAMRVVFGEYLDTSA